MTAAIRAEVAAAAQAAARAGLVEAFGHVSARLPDGGAAITATLPMDTARAEDVIVLDAAGRAIAGAVGDVPLEIWLHLAIYAARPDVGAICRGHPPAAVRWGTGDAELPALHGLGLMAGRRVPVHDSVALVSTPERGAAAARALGSEASLLLRGNGALAVGADPLEAATRLYALEDRARVALSPGPASRPVPAPDWDARLTDSPIELTRARRWFTHHYTPPPTPPTAPATGSASASPFGSTAGEAQA
ncbi:class II aldolase/adducin family protein [Actinocorallia sp. A-T 12471]|uniref:class II aldolase/adducin family protein n=1 Tax=Actinocorallia sp. A-T 12471 TaxID=3089813 RepID=UPI0029D14848|nr:class II aldolase/adducin family protein [Actinocorallia sp. A-T 12471]MDX6739628.1 class II aldolase/adducin family protein [Actinocorallia sp. A-T 12471]